jgi:anti-repressor protein
MNSLQIFNKDQFGVFRVSTDENGNPLFCLADVCRALNLSNPSQVAQKLDDEDKPKLDLGLPGQQPTYITEPGLYTVILRSDSLLAKPMQKWVTGEVLPTIRKHGAYLTTDAIERVLTNPDTIIRLATDLKKEREEKERLRLQNEIQTKELKEASGKVEYFDEVLQSEPAITATVIAKDLGISASALNEFLNKQGVIYKSGKTWVLYCQYQNQGYTKTKTIH